MSISTVISYCTNDYRFLGKCIEEASLFSKQVIIPVCDHFFNGTPENREMLNATYAQFPKVQFLEFSYSSDGVYPSYVRLRPEDREWAAHWNSLARLLGFYHAESDWILFLDTDEIVEGNRFKKAFEGKVFQEWNAVRLACYYYALKPSCRATKVQDLSLLVRKRCLQPRFFYQRNERFGMYARIEGKKEAGLRGLDQRPLIHHYSWVRPEAECFQKVATWSHSKDENWEKILKEKRFSEAFKTLFGTELEFEEADVYFDPLSVEMPKRDAKGNYSNVEKISMRDFLRLELEWEALL